MLSEVLVGPVDQDLPPLPLSCRKEESPGLATFNSYPMKSVNKRAVSDVTSSPPIPPQHPSEDSCMLCHAIRYTMRCGSRTLLQT